MKRQSFLPEIVVDRHRPRTTEYERRKARQIEQVKLVARRPELGPAGRHTQQLDRAEPVGEMDSQHRYEENRSHRQAYKWDESSEQDGEAADEFGQNGEPCHKMRRGHANRMQDDCEGFGPAEQFREAMLHETIPDNQP
jgi:hypothetical protein